MEKSRDAQAPEKEAAGQLKALPKKVLPTPVRVERRQEHEPWERMVVHYSLTPHAAAKGCLGAQLDCDIAANIDRYRLKWGEPLHVRFSRHLVSALL